MADGLSGATNVGRKAGEQKCNRNSISNLTSDPQTQHELNVQSNAAFPILQSGSNHYQSRNRKLESRLPRRDAGQEERKYPAAGQCGRALATGPRKSEAAGIIYDTSVRVRDETVIEKFEWRASFTPRCAKAPSWAARSPKRLGRYARNFPEVPASPRSEISSIWVVKLRAVRRCFSRIYNKWGGQWKRPQNRHPCAPNKGPIPSREY